MCVCPSTECDSGIGMIMTPMTHDKKIPPQLSSPPPPPITPGLTLFKYICNFIVFFYLSTTDTDIYSKWHYCRVCVRPSIVIVSPSIVTWVGFLVWPKIIMRWRNRRKNPPIIFYLIIIFILFYGTSTETVIAGQCFGAEHTPSRRSHVQQPDQNSAQWFCYWLFLVCNGSVGIVTSSHARFSFSTETYACCWPCGMPAKSIDTLIPKSITIFYYTVRWFAPMWWDC